MSMVVESGEADLDRRIHELIERGLSLYGGGDLEGAMGAWRHALALDSDNRRAADYVAYVKRHFDVVDEQSIDAGTFAPADVELEIPFGLLTVGPLTETGIDAYESFEVSGTPPGSAVEEFEEEVPTRVRNAISAEEIDEGWSIEGDESTSGGFANPLITSRTVRDSGAQATSGIEELEAENGRPDVDLAGALADVSANLAELEIPEPGSAPESLGLEITDPTSSADLGLELALPHPGDREKRPSGGDKSTLLGMPDPPKPAAQSDAARATAEISPLELGEALSALQLDDRGASSTAGVQRAESLSDVEFDLGESSAEEPALEFDSKPYASVAIVGEDEPGVGDAMISFRDPAESGLVEVEPAASDLESQLAELEMELKTGSREVEWTKHQDTGTKEIPLEATPPPLAPLEPRQPRKAAPARGRAAKASAPPSGLDAVRAAIESAVDTMAPPSESHADQTRRRIAGFIAYAENELGRDEFSNAAVAADMALAESPESALGQKLIHERSDLLVNVFRKFLGDQSGIVAVALPLHELAKYELDHRTAFLLSRVDGTLTIEDILDVSGMARLEAFRCLARLVLQGVLEVR